MTRLENDCCECATPGYPCKGDSCPNRNVPHYYCDKCKDEYTADTLYIYDGEELCKECLLGKFETIASERGC